MTPHLMKYKFVLKEIDMFEWLDKIELIAKAYEWICPTCGAHNVIKAVPTEEIVTCEECGEKFEVGDYHHAIG